MRFGVTGGAGFIGSTLVRHLLGAGHSVVVLDDFSTGKHSNLAEIVGPLEVVEGTIADGAGTRAALANVDGIFHLAAVASVQKSLDDPTGCHAVNVTGTLNVLEAARQGQAKRVVLSSSAAVYGEADTFPLAEDAALEPISPYGLHKRVNEQYARLYSGQGWLETVSLRYFNIYGPRQDPNGDYAAVVPRFIEAVLAGRSPTIFGDGRQSRDFMFVEDVARANLAAMTTPHADGGIFNVCAGVETDLLGLLAAIQHGAGTALEPGFAEARAGDIRRSVGSDNAIRRTLDLPPWVTVDLGLATTVAAYQQTLV